MKKFLCVLLRVTVGLMAFLVCPVTKDTGWVKGSCLVVEVAPKIFIVLKYVCKKLNILPHSATLCPPGWPRTIWTTRISRRGWRKGTEKSERQNVKWLQAELKIYHLRSSHHFCVSFQGDDGNVGPRGLPGEPVSVSMATQLIKNLSLVNGSLPCDFHNRVCFGASLGTSWFART